LTQLGNLVSGGTNAFALDHEPVVTSIAVEVEGRAVDPAREVGEEVYGVPLHADGWSYDPDKNAVLLHGSAIPGPGVAVRIWYRQKGA
jgi:hypothetical protein